MSQIHNHGLHSPSRLAAIEPAALFANHVLLNTNSLLQARSSVERVFFPHSLRTSRRGAIDFVHRSAPLSEISFNLIRYGADVEVATGDVNRSHFVMVVPLSGEAEVKNHDQQSSLHCGRFVILDPMAGFHFEMLESHSHLAIGIPKTLMLTHVNRLLPRRLAARVEFNRGFYAIDEANRGLFDFIGYICDELDSLRSLTRHAVVSAAMEQAFLTSLISSLLGLEKCEETEGEGFAAPAHLRRAEDFILANLTEEVTLEDITQAAGVPERTLHHAFSRHRGVGPMAWLKLQRLRQARLDLLTGREAGLSVTDVALRYQMPHVGRFARAYEKEFGELPSATLCRA